MTTTPSRVPLVYVLSNGRSGSTLLDLLLGSLDGVWSVGEAQVLPWELEENRAPCGCGVPVACCEFWGPVLDELGLEGTGAGPVPIEHFRDTHGHGRVLRREHLRDLWRGWVDHPRRAAAREYGRANARYLDAVRRRAAELRGEPVRWLVDASKDPYRLLWLAASGRFDLRVLHLVKDPRAFVHSMTRRADPSLARALRFGGRWLVENALARRLCRAGFDAEATRTLRYEDLALRPAAVVAELARWLGVATRQVECGSLRAFRTREGHAVSGSTVRWEAAPIELDERWREGLPAPLQRLVWTLTAPLRAKLGYR